jgi:predicted Zn-dependent protease
MENNNRDSLKRFNALLDANTQQKDAARYGLALTYIKLKNFEVADKLLGSLLFNNPYQLAFQYTDIELDIAQEDYKGALSKLRNLINKNPGNYPLLSLKAETLWLDHQYERSSDVLTVLSRQRKEDPMIWYRLAEVRGLAGNISGVHEARAEYFILVGAFKLAREQLSLALKLVLADFKRSSVIRQRLRDVVNMEERMERL